MGRDCQESLSAMQRLAQAIGKTLSSRGRGRARERLRARAKAMQNPHRHAKPRISSLSPREPVALRTTIGRVDASAVRVGQHFPRRGLQNHRFREWGNRA